MRHKQQREPERVVRKTTTIVEETIPVTPSRDPREPRRSVREDEYDDDDDSNDE